MFEIGEQVIINENIKSYYPSVSGEVATITRVITSSPNYQYDVELPNGDYTPVRVSEINKLTEEQKELITYINKGNMVLHSPSRQKVIIVKVDYIHNQAEIEFYDNSNIVVGFETLKVIEKEVDSVEESKYTVHDDLLKLFFEHYKNEDDTYTLPKELLVNILKRLYVEGE